MDTITKLTLPLEVHIPLTVPKEKHEAYSQNLHKATRDSGRLFLFAGDQKIEHLNDDFHGEGIPEECGDPEHLFKIAQRGNVGAFASHLGLIAHYAGDYPEVNYLIKLNGKTNLMTQEFDDPLSMQLNSVEEIIEFKKNNNLSIVGVGYTVYLGSNYEAQMLSQAAQIITKAHEHGLLVVLWMYPRGMSVENPKSVSVIAGAAGVGASLGADFVKVNAPEGETGFERAEDVSVAVRAAGRTGVVCSGGSSKPPKTFLENLYHQLHAGGTRGAAVGRNIHQKPLEQAVQFCNAISKLIVEDAPVQKALEILGE